VGGDSAFVEEVIFRDLRLRGAGFRVGRGSNGDDERDVGKFRVGFGSECEGHVTMGPAAIKAGNGGCVGAELALGQEKRRIRGSSGIGGDGIEDFVRKVGNGEVGGRGHDGRRQDRGAVGQGWDQNDGGGLLHSSIEEHKTAMKIKVRKTMNYEDYESTLYSWIFVGTVGLTVYTRPVCL
jgi:hypothetical protein